ncbi:efflux transporter periplasmic adaptor subunit [Vibrio sp. 10N.286.49.C2]|uniref:efflux RND transporter periplasmic adaptor subunit n=1 Tax=unclassified Vibrio TaxID=2614977 RepID=UPI000C852D68|nr:MULTISPECIES: efflux RND transporter periplasmic adaptor subunit [unclassified Vibrio]PMH33183.1 efflux transporter periplasmic adaptor subunit [Vibrio sp. 10N.286.49.C2]PMH51203.1 efflux transporter periplasmic adaptor subunit [Vibrio sp. 10N.286.49.B1]PMH81965.1 efflux transporter periplasmic adaptor subunit [Vibrio sp. 10N.286.48.B7]
MNTYRLFKRSAVIVFPALAAISLSGCHPAQSEIHEPVIKPVKVIEVPALNFAPINSYLAQVDATDRAQLSFQVGGQVASIDVKMGESVQAGEILATLDPTDYQVALDARQAEFDLADSQLTRAQQLFKKKLISADMFDRQETQYKAAEAALEQAKADLGYTQIIAPFEGVVSMTYRKAYEVVGEKQPILNLISSNELDVTFSIPVPVVKSMTFDELKQQLFFVTLDSHRNQQIAATFREIAMQPDLDTNSYTASVSIKKPDNINILSGMSGQVYIQRETTDRAISLPLSAWISQQDGEGQVWRFEPSTQEVHQIRLILNEQGEITAGLQHGDQVVVAGARNLIEGQQVKLWTREGGI